MKVYDALVDERLRMAALLESLTADQLARPSLCTGWTVHDVAAHLVTYLRYGQVKIYLGILATGADFDRWNIMLTRRAARRPTAEIIARLRAGAAARTTIPRSGYDPVLTDIVLHDLDIRLALGIHRQLAPDRLRVAFRHLAERPSPGYSMGHRLDGLRVTATDTGWSHGAGALVTGPAEPLVLAMAGRRAALGALSGDGVPILRDRLAGQAPRPALRHRLAAPLRVLLSPPPRERRARAAVLPE
ncbi:maleylpyruvate isomerase family mycothiol-dependent enzyme [Actinoplanes sp. NPDC051861]|uniref:maleylpyruvate isomerase family mycothiol-dependent enzyme n=1 Tax=Actinoplanes sp. NPDC051861 TaxID=3155170 RepID=UPI0034267962